MTFDHPNSQYAKAKIKYCYNFATYFKEKFLFFSCDDKSKIKVGIPAVSKFVFSRRYFTKENKPETPDHDFPIGNKYLITPSGYSLF